MTGLKVKLQHFLCRTLFGTLYVRGRERTVFFNIRVGKVNLQDFLSRTLFGKQYVKGKELTVFFNSRVGKLSHSMLHLVMRYYARRKKLI